MLQLKPLLQSAACLLNLWPEIETYTQSRQNREVTSHREDVPSSELYKSTLPFPHVLTAAHITKLARRVAHSGTAVCEASFQRLHSSDYTHLHTPNEK